MTASPAPTLAPAPPRAPWRIGIDVGGTFTDMVLADAAGRIEVFKVPSVPADPSEGVLAALAGAAARYGVATPELLAGCTLFVHGSTVATNTMLERKGAKVGLLATQGFRDSLEIRRGIREDQWDHRRPHPEVLVPRYLRRPVRGRIDRGGAEIEPLEADDIEAAVRIFAAEGVESIAVSLINCFLNPAHERACAALIDRLWDGEWLSVSSEIVPIMGEYERSSTTVVNAYLAPRIVSYLRDLGARLSQLGLKGSLLLVQSNGGIISLERAAQRPVNLVLSGPAAGVGALNHYRCGAGSDDLISMEIGGTSCDVALMNGGSVTVRDELVIEGYHLAVPAVEIHTIGAGGGTIARVDDGGMLHVGPRGAGARPGPASYGLGGTEPTVTDAQLVLGRLRPGSYAEGAVNLDLGLAREAIERAVARPLGLDVEQAAAGIIRLVEQNLLLAVQRISIERGHDARRFTLVAAGGAGPMHGAVIGRALGCPRVYVPHQAGAYCAIGMLHSDVRQDDTQVYLATLDQARLDDLETRFAALETDARSVLVAEGFDGQEARLHREFDLRYRGQQWSIRVRLENGAVIAPAVVRLAFEAEYERLYGHIQPGGVIEITSLRVIGTGLLDLVEPAPAAPATEAAVALESRRVYLYQRRGWRDIPVYAGAALAPGHRLGGPLLVEEQTVPIRLSPIPTTSRVLPIPRVKLGLGRAAISPAMSSAS